MIPPISGHSPLGLGLALGACAVGPSPPVTKTATTAPLSVDSYVGKICYGQYYGRDRSHSLQVYPYALEIVREGGGPFATYADISPADLMSVARMKEALSQWGYPALVKTHGDSGGFLLKTSMHVTFEATPVDSTHIHLLRAWNGTTFFGFFQTSTATCQ